MPLERDDALPDEEQNDDDHKDSKDPDTELCGEQGLAARPAALLAALGKELAAAGDEVAVAVDHLATVVDRSAKARTLTR